MHSPKTSIRKLSITYLKSIQNWHSNDISSMSPCKKLTILSYIYNEYYTVICKKYRPNFEHAQRSIELERAEIWNITVPHGLLISL